MCRRVDCRRRTRTTARTTTPPTTAPRTTVQDGSGASAEALSAPNRGAGLLMVPLRGFPHRHPPIDTVTDTTRTVVIIIVTTADQDQEGKRAIDLHLPILSSPPRLWRCCPPSPPPSGRAYANRTKSSSRARRTSKAVWRRPLAICPVETMWPRKSSRQRTRPSIC